MKRVEKCRSSFVEDCVPACLPTAGSVRWLSTISAAAPGSVARAAGPREPGSGFDRGRLLAPPFGEAKGGRGHLHHRVLERSHRRLVLLLAAFTLAPCLALAQSDAVPRSDQPTTKPPTTNNAPLNPTTLAVILANKPERFTEVEWLRMLERPVARSVYPLKVTQAMLDTLDATELDRRFTYMMGK